MWIRAYYDKDKRMLAFGKSRTFRTEVVVNILTRHVAFVSGY
jgi:hypothetical protein